MTAGHQAYRTASIETASPEQLTLMCYDGALKFMRRAQLAADDGDLEKLSSFVGRAQAVVNELNVTLNMEAGGDIAQNLRNIYLFVNRHLTKGVIDHDSRVIGEAMGLIRNLREAWAQAMNLGSAAA